ncbi:ribonuclease H-like domain-containing protein [Tanacetum coccineum]
MSARYKISLGYSTQLNELSSNHETDSENSLSIFDVRSSDEENTPENDRFLKNGYKAVPLPITGNFLTPRANVSFAGSDEYTIRNKIIKSQTTELNTKTSETAGQTNAKKPKSVNDEEEEYEVQTVRPKTQTVQTRDDKSGQNSKKQGIGFRKVKTCFVCKSTDHLIKDCNFHDKKSQEPKLKNVVNTGQREGKPVWDNAKRINHQNFSKYPHLSKTFVPSGVLTRTGLHRPSVSTARPVCTARPICTARPVSTDRLVCTAKPSVSTARPVCTTKPSVSTTRLVCTAKPSVSTARPVCTAKPSVSTARPVYATRPIYPKMDNVRPRGSCSPIKRVQNMTTAGTRAVVNTGKGKLDTDFKKSRWVWRPKGNYLDHVSKDSGSFMLKKVEAIQISCYRIIQWWIVVALAIFLAIKLIFHTMKISIEALWLLEVIPKEFNLFSVSQMCDKKNSVLFTESECLILSPSFMLFDESQVVLRAPRKDDVYSLDLKNIVPSGERKNKTLIEAVRTMLADSLLPIPFWAEAVNSACYVLNRVLVTKPQNKTPYELLIGKSPNISFMRPFGCPLTNLNTLDSLAKFDGKSDEGYLLGYSTSSKAFRVYNKRTKRVEENLHINFLEDQPNVTGTGPNWMFDLDFLTNSMNYIPVSVENQVNVDAGTQDSYVAGSSGKDKGPTQEYILLPLQPHRTRILIEDVAPAAHEKPSESSPKDNDIQDSGDVIDKVGQHQMPEDEQVLHDELEKMKAAQAISTNKLSTDRQSVSTDRQSVSTDRPFVSTDRSNTPYVSAARTSTGANAGESSFVYLGGKIPIDASTLPNADLPIDPNMPDLEDASDTLPNDGIFNGAYDDDEDVGAVADFNNMDNTIAVSPIPTLRIHKDHPKGQILGDPTSAIQTRGKIQKASLAQQALVSYIHKQNITNHKDHQNCLFACFLSQKEPKTISQALQDERWVEAMQEELLQFKLQKVWVLVDLSYGKKIGIYFDAQGRFKSVRLGFPEEDDLEDPSKQGRKIDLIKGRSLLFRWMHKFRGGKSAAKKKKNPESYYCWFKITAVGEKVNAAESLLVVSTEIEIHLEKERIASSTVSLIHTSRVLKCRFRIHFDKQTKSLPLLFWIYPRYHQEELYIHKEEMAPMALSDSEVKTCSKTCLTNYETLKKQYDDLIFKLHETEFKAISYKRGLDTVEAQLVTYRKNEVLFSEEVVVLKREVGVKQYEINMLKTEFEKVKQEKEGIDFKIEKFENASKDLDKLLGSQITDNSKKGLGYNAVPPPHPLIYNRPNKLDLSYSGLEEFQQPEFEGYGLRANKSVCENSSNETKKNSDAPLIEEWVFDNEDEVESPVVVEKKIVVPTIPKVNVVRPKQQEKSVRKIVRYAEMYRSKGPRGNQRN